MELKITPLSFGETPEVPQPDNRLLTILGEEGIRKLVSDHYDLIANSKIKHLFPPKGKGLEIAKQKSADFFIQRLGGPDYYEQHRGKPMLVSRHRYFNITSSYLIVWLDCYRQVLQTLDAPQEVIISFWNFLDLFSNWMVNTREPGDKHN